MRGQLSRASAWSGVLFDRSVSSLTIVPTKLERSKADLTGSFSGLRPTVTDVSHGIYFQSNDGLELFTFWKIFPTSLTSENVYIEPVQSGIDSLKTSASEYQLRVPTANVNHREISGKRTIINNEAYDFHTITGLFIQVWSHTLSTHMPKTSTVVTRRSPAI